MSCPRCGGPSLVDSGRCFNRDCLDDDVPGAIKVVVFILVFILVTTSAATSIALIWALIVLVRWLTSGGAS